MTKFFTITLMLVALTQTVNAQQATPAPKQGEEQELTFTSLDWNEMQIDSVLPVYTEVVPLETDYRTHTYTVSVLYPEYVALTAKETEVAERFDSLVSETIDVRTFVGIERGKGLLDISFIPIRDLPYHLIHLPGRFFSTGHALIPKVTDHLFRSLCLSAHIL